MNVGRQREWKKRSQKRRAGIRGAASILGKDLAGAVEDLPVRIEIPRDVVRALARAEGPPSLVKRFLAEGRDPAEAFLEFVERLRNATPEAGSVGRRKVWTAERRFPLLRARFGRGGWKTV